MALFDRGDLEQISLMIAIGDKYKSAKLLEALPESLRAQVIYLANQLSVQTPQSIQRLNQSLKIDVGSILGLKQDAEKLASMVALVSPPIAADLLKRLIVLDQELAHRLAENIFFFDDIIKMPDYALQICLFEIGRHGIGLSDIASALWGCDHEIKDKFLRNISKRRAQVIEDELSYFEDLPAEVVFEAKQKCAALISQYAAQQGLVIPRPNGDTIIWLETVGRLPNDLQQVVDKKLETIVAMKESDLAKFLLEIPHITLTLCLLCAKNEIKQKILHCAPRSGQRQYAETEPLALRNGVYFQQVLDAFCEMDEIYQSNFNKK